MATRVVEGKKPYTGGKAINIDENKVISLKLRDENNLIIYDEGDDEIYVDLQLPNEIEPTDAFPVGVNTGRVIVDNGRDLTGTIICAKTTSGDNIQLLYADDGTLWIDNGTGTFKQIYFKADVDLLISTLTTYINTELAKKQNGVTSDTAPSNPSEGDLWYDTTNGTMKVWDGTAWQSVGTGGGGSDIVYATQAEYNALLPGALTDNKHYFIYTESNPGSINYTITGSTTVGSYTPATYSDIQGCYISPDGTKMYISFWNNFSGILVQYDLSTAWDVTTATQVRTLNVTQPDGIYFSNDGLYFYIGREGDSFIRRYSMSTAWDISTATQDQSLGLGSNFIYQISFSEDGKHLFYSRYETYDTLWSYDLTTARDLTTATNQKSYYTPGFVLVGISVNNEGSYLYTATANGDNIKQYELDTPYDITSNKTEIGTYSLTGQNEGRAFYVSLDGKYRAFGTGSADITQYQAQPIS